MFRLLLWLLFLPAAVLENATVDDEALVLAASPFVSVSTPDHPVEIRYSFQRADLDAAGSRDYIVAMYGDGYDGYVRVLKPQNGGPNVVADAAPRSMVGTGPRVRLVDLDGDGKPEIVASGVLNHGEQTWIYRWNGSLLSLISPAKFTRRGTQISLLGTCEFFDVDGDGKVDIVASAATPEADPVVYKTDFTGRYVQSGVVKYVNNFVRTIDPLDVFTGVFSTQFGESLLVTATIVGSATTRPSAEVFFNGVQVLAPANFSSVVERGERSVWRAQVSVTAEDENEVEVDLSAGAPDSVATVSVVPAASAATTWRGVGQ